MARKQQTTTRNVWYRIRFRLFDATTTAVITDATDAANTSHGASILCFSRKWIYEERKKRRNTTRPSRASDFHLTFLIRCSNCGILMLLASMRCAVFILCAAIKWMDGWMAGWLAGWMDSQLSIWIKWQAAFRELTFDVPSSSSPSPPSVFYPTFRFFFIACKTKIKSRFRSSI